MATATSVARIRATEVVVRARENAIESPSTRRPLHNKPWKGAAGWSLQFDELPKVVLELELEDGTTGLGECYRAHDWDTVDALAQSLLGTDIRSMTLQNLPLPRVHEYDGFEMAVWDAYARAVGVRVVDLLGGPVRREIPVNAWSGHRTVDDLGSAAKAFRAAGFTALKLKCSLEDDIVAACARVADCAPGLNLVLDPNGRFERLSQARRLAHALHEVGNVSCLEDPIPSWMVTEWTQLRAAVPIPLARHLMLAYPQFTDGGSEVIGAIRHGTCDMFNFTAGLADFQRLSHVADLAGTPCWHGSQVDLGIAEAAYLHSCAAAPSCSWPSDVFGRMIRSHDLLVEPLEIRPPYAVLPDGPGLGVVLDDDARRAYRVHEKEYRRS